MGHGVDPQGKLEPEDRFADCGIDRLGDFLPRLTSQALPGSICSGPGKVVNWWDRRRIDDEQADVGLKATKGMGLIKPADDALVTIATGCERMVQVALCPLNHGDCGSGIVLNESLEGDRI
jgi:hypothetical protein